MLSFFPTPYPDELWYSVLSRYFAYSGYFAKCRNNSVNRDLLGNRMRRYVPFYGTNLNNFLTQLPNNFITADEIILQHTLYPYYARFFDASRKENALQTMLGEGKQHSSLMLLMGNEQTKTKHDKYLRYCPFCSQEDMEQYGETYWHRIHQIDDLRICPKHNVFLNNSHFLTISSKKLCPPIYEIEEADTTSVSPEELNFAKLSMDVLNAPIDSFTHCVRDVFGYALLRKGYVKPNGRKTALTRLYNDFCEFKEKTDTGKGALGGIDSVMDISNILCGKRAMGATLFLASFLDMNVHDIVFHPSESLRQRWDREFVDLLLAGETENDIALKFGMSKKDIRVNRKRLNQ